MRYVYLVTFFIVVLGVGMAGFRGTPFTKPPIEVFPDMDRQEKYKAQARSAFFADGRTERPIPVGVVARGDLRADDMLYSGKDAAGSWVKGFPASVTVDNVLMARGKERFDIYCAPCHGRLGDGKGIVTNYGWGTPANFHSDQFRNMSEGELFNTITHGKNTMFGYADKLVPQDRWAVIAYLRALQRAHNGRAADVPAAHKAELGIQ